MSLRSKLVHYEVVDCFSGAAPDRATLNGVPAEAVLRMHLVDPQGSTVDAVPAVRSYSVQLNPAQLETIIAHLRRLVSIPTEQDGDDE